MTQPVISVEHLSKSYQLGQINTGTFTNDLKLWWARARGKPNPFLRIGEVDNGNRNGEMLWALRDVSFQVQQGEVLGIIGRNGAGKSTLLKILSRVTAPTEGRIRAKGRIASLLEVGTGFHPELTGRENIYLNGAILGMSRAEVARKFDEIVDFAGVEKFIDTPVKRYSSGMYVRLAFAVAAHLDAEIMVVDEVLAVGDVEFQKKCLGKMGDVAKGGRTVLFVSHNMAAVQNLCERGIVLQEGQIRHQGDIDTSVSSYLVGQKEENCSWKRKQGSNGQMEINEISISLRGEQPRHTLHISLTLLSNHQHRPAFIAIDISSSFGNTIMQAIPTIVPFISSDNQRHACEVEIELPPLIPGRYWVTTWVGSHNTATLDEVENSVSFEIETSPTNGRSFPHHSDHGPIVPLSKIIYNGELIAK